MVINHNHSQSKHHYKSAGKTSHKIACTQSMLKTDSVHTNESSKNFTLVNHLMHGIEFDELHLL